ncbi:hypothetical protein JQ633_34030 [Bradyrhizobium tropiciagri]|uniref:hypothetical protein n=1 Tax=Bradyrhizobium tropiciagri TaxID=312253 RepID=UPI001BA93A9B|nr:hypothetical protein [Bradyrhizobium tropiciagri]MBR0875416.1 hypothetical protein [Bradyrhizobium tropiciagri]
MSADPRVHGGATNSRSWSLTRWAFGLVVIFCGVLITGVLVVFGLSASWCLLSPASRCFSVQRDTVDAALMGLQIWSMPAILVATLVASISEICGAVVWWNVLIVAALSMLMSGVLISGLAEFAEVPVLMPASLVLFVGVQLSRSISNRFGGYSL